MKAKSRLSTGSSSEIELSAAEERMLHGFEQAWKGPRPPVIRKFWKDECPDAGFALLEELVRVDMEFRADRGLPFSTRDYLQEFGELKELRDAVARIESEERRLNASKTRRPPSGTASFPMPGTRFLDFELIDILGKGAFGCVYLARQPDLARRFVALKVTRGNSVEAQQLARLQHTNIVPVFSVHQSGDLHAICMPFLGVATFADLVADPASHQNDVSIQQLVTTIAEKKRLTLPSLGSAGGTFPVEPIAARPDTPRLNSGVAVRFRSLQGRNRDEAFALLWHATVTGLAYAHERGIVHGDVKPANILINDDGEPLLLDFNLASSRTAADVKPNVVGGTVPYMSESHIEAVLDGSSADESSDLFSLGVVFYQLISGELPFPVYSGELEETADRMIGDRRRGAQPIRRLVPRLHQDLATIVDKCIASDPNCRYRDAASLVEDLDRVLNCRPLVHAPNRSFSLRFRNWRRRHPRLTSASSIAALAAIVVAGLGVLFVANQNRLKRIEDLEAVRVWREELDAARAPLSLVDSPPAIVNRNARALENVLENPPEVLAQALESDALAIPAAEWRDDMVRAARARLRLSAAILGKWHSWQERSELDQALENVRENHQMASRIFPEIVNTPGYVLQSSRLAELSGEANEAAKIRERANALPIRENDDRILVAHEKLLAGDSGNAIQLLELAIGDDGDNFEAWLLLGNAWDIAGNPSRAEACFSVCLGLDAKSPTALFHRALARSELDDLNGAHEDYSRAIENEPGEPVYYANRALIEMANENWAAAEQDLSRAIELDNSSTRLRYLRYQIRQATGDEKGAESDFAQFLKQEPDDEESRLVRGAVLLQQGDRTAALREFEQVIARNPENPVAWNNKATVEDLEGNRDNAIQAMSEVIRLQPDNPTALATRGVLHARKGDRERALADARSALELDSSPDTCYRVAGIYALTSNVVPADKSRAIALIAKAALEQPQLVLGYLDVDPDIAPVINEPGMRELRKALEDIRQLTDAGSEDPAPDEVPDE
jgi:eukaryotic-like serine/threonine-protein kinase